MFFSGAPGALCDRINVSTPDNFLEVLVAGKESLGVFEILIQVPNTTQSLDVLRTHEIAIWKAARSQGSAENASSFWFVVHYAGFPIGI